MKRRDFLRTLTPTFFHHPAIQRAFRTEPISVATGLEPYKPDEKLSVNDAIHLLRRCCFEPTEQDITRATGMTPQEAIDYLLRDLPLPDLPEWYTTTDPLSPQELRTLTYEELIQYIQQQNQNMLNGIYWWYDLMLTTDFSLREKMVLFFHDHFTSGYQEVRIPHYMIQQNQLFRENAFGNLKDLTKKIVYDPAMLVYLNGNVNTLRNPNENFGRELVELFTMGEGNYTEWDVVEISRVCTGWFNTYEKPYYNFDPNPKNPRFRRHDYLPKEIFGEIIDPQVNDTMSEEEIRQRGMQEVDQLIDLIYRQRCDESRGYEPSHPYYGKAVSAIFFARKLYQTFVYEHENPLIVAQLADILEENNFNLAPTLKILLQSAHFFDENFRGAQIKSPIDFTVGILRLFDYPTLYRGNAAIWNLVLRNLFSLNTNLGLQLFQPPDVSGWPGYRNWINTFTLPYRLTVTDIIIRTPRGEVLVPIYQFSLQFPSLTVDVRAFVREVTDRFLSFPPIAEEFEELVEELLQGAPDYEWPEIAKDPQAATPRLEAFYRAVMHLPQFQLF